MKDFYLIRWITQLKEQDRILVILLIGVSALWGQSLWDKQIMNGLREKLVKHADDCATEKLQITKENTMFLKDELKKAQNLVDSMARVNLRVISANNKRIKHSK